MSVAALKIIELSEKGLCACCHKCLLQNEVIAYYQFYGVQVGVCGGHKRP